MIINRHNYEEFFLLYVDNELGNEERTEVERFAEENPDLKKELEMLQHTTLANNEDICFKQKELLFKEENEVTLANYEAYFLLSVDKELDEKQAEQLKRFILQHPQLQQELVLLQKTELVPANIEFANKEILYKRETKVIPLALRQLSIAASIMAVVALSWIFIVRKDADSTIQTVSTDIKKGIKKTTPVIVEKGVTEQPIATLHEKNAGNKADDHLVAIAVKGSNAKNVFARKTIKRVHAIKTDDLVPKVQTSAPDIAESKPVQAEKIITAPSKSKAITEAIAQARIDDDGGLKAGLVKNKTDEEASPVVVSQAVYREIEDHEEEKSLYIGSMEINKNKLRSLFKKAAGLFDKKSRNEDEKTVRIASFSIKSK